MGLPPIPLPPYVSMPGEPFELGSLTDIISVLVAVGSGIVSVAALLYARSVANRQLKMMEKQDTIIHKQVALMTEQRDISQGMEAVEQDQKALLEQMRQMLERQGQMTEKQGQIAGDQQKLVRDQLARRAQLKLSVTYKKPKPGTSPGHTTYVLRVHNGGDKSCKELYRALLIPRDRVTEVGVGDDASHVDEYAIVDSQYFHHISIHVEKTIFPDRIYEVGIVTVNKADQMSVKHVPLLWAIISEDGREPETQKEFHQVLVQQEAWQPGEKRGSPV